jgi:hypothetical protein
VFRVIGFEVSGAGFGLRKPAPALLGPDFVLRVWGSSIRVWGYSTCQKKRSCPTEQRKAFLEPCWRVSQPLWEVDTRLHREGNSNSHGARPINQNI